MLMWYIKEIIANTTKKLKTNGNKDLKTTTNPQQNQPTI